MARPTKRTTETVKSICDFLKAGVPRTHAAVASGISFETFSQWMKFPAFHDAVKKAEAEAVARNVAIIQKAAQDTWTAAAWWLERRCPADFSKQDKLDVTSGGKPVNDMLGLSDLPDDELDKRIERIKARKADKAI